jgi:LemA protein
MTGLIVLVVVLVVVAFIVIGIYNRLVALRQETNQAFADIDVQLNQRRDLIPNLVETVKGYATHESATLQAVTDARVTAGTAKTVQDKVQAENALTGALRQLFAVAESYPDLKANGTFLSLQEALSDVENRLAAARRFFNTAIQQFPAVLIAGMFGFGPRSFFDLGEEGRAAADAPPQVSFS